MNELQIFSYSDKQVRTLLRNGEPFKQCQKALCCHTCKGKQSCKGYANWNENKSYSGSEPWMTPEHWKHKNAK